MLGLHLSYKWLHFTRPTGPPAPVPAPLERHWLSTPSGQLEILSTPSTSAPSSRPPILFCHGGMGSAGVWAEYMTFFAAEKHQIPCYAVSLRGHGASWYPSYLRMVFATSRSALASDLVAALEWVQAREGGKQVVLVGHSSGGGLSQGILANGQAHVRALALLGAVPGYGSMNVYMNWAKLDPWFTIRLLFHCWHSNSPLSHPKLIQRAFFGDKFPLESVIPFLQRMNRYEAYLWPFSMMRPFADAVQAVQRIDHQSAPGRDSVLVMAGSQDKLMTREETLKTAAYYQHAMEGRQDQVRVAFVEGAGHHLQNDVQWQDGAAQLLAFYLQA